MIIDIHIHEKTHSSDSHITLREIVTRGKAMGLNGVCITDHESNGIAEEAYSLSKEQNFLILVGAEILTYEGDMLVFGLKQLPKEKLSATELMNFVRKHQGIAISAHPFRPNNRGMGYFNRRLKGFWGIEAFNGSTHYYHNQLAYNLAAELKLPSLGGSDAHHLHQLGRYATRFDGNIRDEKDLIEAIMFRKVAPVAYENGIYQAIEDRNITKAV